MRQGSEQCVIQARDLLPQLKHLESFAYIGPDDKDHGINVRMR